MTSSSIAQAMVDVDKIASDAEYRHNRKAWLKANNLQLKDFSIVVLLMLFGYSPLVVAAILCI